MIITPFGSPLPGRKFDGTSYKFGFNGKEKDDETSGEGNSYDYGFRIYNSQLGRFLSVDPLFKSYPWYTPYQFAGNKPIIAVDLDGLEEFIVVSVYQNNALLGYQYIHVPSSLRIIDETQQKFNGVAYFRWDVDNNYKIDTKAGLFPVSILADAKSFLRGKRDVTYSNSLSSEHNEFLNGTLKTRHPEWYNEFNSLLPSTPDYYDGYMIDVCLIKPTTSPIFFESNSFEIKDAYKNELDKLGEYMLNITSSKYEIDAFTDDVGTTEVNLKLSQQRAQAAVDYLVNNYGIDPSRLNAKGYGEGSPIEDNSTESGRAKNRRVEFKPVQ